MKNQHEAGHFTNRMLIILFTLIALFAMAGQSFAALSCNACHGMPPLDSTDSTRQPVTGAVVGNHQTHLGTTSQPAECTKCHANSGYNSTHASTSNYNIKMSSNIFNSASTAKYTKGVSFAQTATPTLGKCNNVNCHFEKQTLTWGASPTTTNCSSCHAAQPSTGSHSKHIAGMTLATVTYAGNNSCSQCHPYYGFGSYSITASKSKFSHATSAGAHKIVVNTFLVYTGGTAKSYLPSQTATFTTCRATQCHDTGRDGARTIKWGTSKSACTACHALQPATGSHTKHLSGLNAAQFTTVIACNDCHKGYVEGTTASADHLNGYIDVYKTNKNDLGVSYTATRAKAQTFASCNTSYCHSNGNSDFYAATWGGTSTGCTFCHPTLSAGHTAHTDQTVVNFYNNTSNKSTAAANKFGCGSCHPNNVASHMNGYIETDLAPAAAGGSLKLKNLAGATLNGAKKCINVYCHSNGYSASFRCATTLAWTDKFRNYTSTANGKKDSCSWCHGNSPNTGGKTGSSAHSAHAVGIHYDDIYNGVSRKLPLGGGSTVNAAHGRNNRSTTINCNICHAGTMGAAASSFYNDRSSACVSCHNGSTAPLKGMATIADYSKHANGKVDVDFITQKIATKAQVAQSAFAAYTAAGSGSWSRKNVAFKTLTSSYDETKAALSTSPAYTTASGCAVACHSKITVLWTDTVTCTSCHTRLK